MMRMYESNELVQDENLNFLEHYGIKGQKWGLRRFQNPDGSYTELGKERRRVGFKEESEEDKDKKSKNTTETPNTKIGGKAYKDMTRKELRAAKKRARHNEVERRATREFNRDKREAIENGDISFISKNISRFSNDEIDEAVNRYKKMQDFKKLELANRKNADYFIEKTVKFLNNAERIVNPITNISNKINDASKKASETRNQKITEEKNALDLLWKKNPDAKPLSKSDKVDLENKELLRDITAANKEKAKAEAEKAKANSGIEKDKRENLKFEADLIKERMKEQREEEKAIKQKIKELKERIKEAKANQDHDKDISEWKKAVAEEELRAAEDLKAQNEQRNKEYQAMLDEREKELKEAKKAAAKNTASSNTYDFTSDEDRSGYKWGWFGSNKKGKSNNVEFDLDDEKVNNITKKYAGKLKQSEIDYFKENTVRNEKWKKDLSKHDSKVLDDWIKKMTKKYQEERKMDKATAEKYATRYVDAWIDFYDEGKL